MGLLEDHRAGISYRYECGFYFTTLGLTRGNVCLQLGNTDVLSLGLIDHYFSVSKCFFTIVVLLLTSCVTP